MEDKNCNDCKFIGLTEGEQMDNRIPHVCLLYRIRLSHRSTSPSKYHGYIYPCNKCNGKDFVEDSNRRGKAMDMKLMNNLRMVDDLGRVSIPKELRRELEIEHGAVLRVTVLHGGIFMEKVSEPKKYTCAVTGKECSEDSIPEDTKPCMTACKIGMDWLARNQNIKFHDED